MGRGIRKFVNAKFAETLPERAAIGNTAFRKNIMLAAMTEYGISIDSASAHYNFAFKKAKEHNPASVEGLGRAPEKNKGGRKRKVAVEAAIVTPAPITLVNVIKVKTGEVVATAMERDVATALIIKAAAQKKSKLAIAEPEAVTA